MALTHAQIWSALDAVAARQGLTASGLARAAGLDASSFNPSKRETDGRPRWPSTESLMRALQAAGVSTGEFADLAGDQDPLRNSVPLVGMARAGRGGAFDPQGFSGHGHGVEMDHTALPVATPTMISVRVTGDSMEPVYREGDRVVVDRALSDVRKGDRVVVQTIAGEVMVKEYAGGGAIRAHLNSLNPSFAPIVIPRREIDWMSRVLWVSQ